MPKMRLDALDEESISICVYGPPGSAKTTLPTTLFPDDPYSVGYITSERSGLKTLRAMGFPPDMEFELLALDGNDPFERVVTVMDQYIANPKVKVICFDGITHTSGLFIDHFTDGEGEKQMGWEGWGEMLTRLRRVEQAGERAKRKGKSVVYTAWELPPEYENTLGGSSLKSPGGPYLNGKGRIWLPGTCDIVCRQSSSFKTINVGGKAQRQFVSTLHLKQCEEWTTRTKYAFLPESCPANLRHIVELVKKAGVAGKPQPAVKPVAPKPAYDSKNPLTLNKAAFLKK